jgi:hypothetical protein
MFRAIQFVLAIAALLAAPAAVQAAGMLFDATTSATIFDDGFETATVGNWISGSPTHHTPVNVGVQWTADYWNTTTCVSIEDASTAGFAANEGSQFVKVLGDGRATFACVQGDGIRANSGAGDQIVFRGAFRSTGADNAILALVDGQYVSDSNRGALLSRVLFQADGSVGIVKADESGYDPLTQTYNLNAWNLVEVSHTNGTTNWSVSINGQTPETHDGPAAGLTSLLSSIRFETTGPVGSGAVTYWDAQAQVPEPSTIMLLATGLIGLLAYAWRKRR